LLERFVQYLFCGILIFPFVAHGASADDPANLVDAANFKYYERLERPAEFSEFDYIQHCFMDDYAKSQQCLDADVFLYGQDKTIPVLLKTLDSLIRKDTRIVDVKQQTLYSAST